MAEKRKGLYTLDDNPLWYKDAIIYELHVRAFHDSDGDGVGDFRGLTGKLDYLQDLGITALWLLPFYPSPLKDDGYDISDYQNVHHSYGTLADFRLFLREAHRRGIRVITELVVNHTSDQHPWFQRARRAPRGSKWRDFYVWSDTQDKYRDTRIIFKDFESSNWSWDPVANAYYWHRFYSHQPDLNFDNPAVGRLLFRVLQFWLGMGVDGLRLDAVPYLIEREGTNCENLPETHKALKAIRKRVDDKFRNRMLLAEANQWPEDAVDYFGEGDECHMAFHFPLMPRMFMAVRMEDRYPIIDILTQTPQIPDVCQWALFLRNHDELTLEMVTDEERDYMYRVYAHDHQARINLGIRRRLVPLLGKDRRKFELMNALLFSLPGTPVIYYGDEIGMGDNIYVGDRNGVRTPMQWSVDRNAGFSRAPAQRLYLPVNVDPDYHYETVNVEARQNNTSSPLWYMKRLLSLRKRFQAFGRGTIEFLYPDNPRVLAFIRSYEEEMILVVANLSRFSQFVELNLSAFQGRIPVEMFGQTEFPVIKEQAYFLTLGPHAFYWFALEQQQLSAGEIGPVPGERKVPELQVAGSWENLFRKEGKGGLERILPGYLKMRRWFGGKARRIKSTTIREAVPLPGTSPPSVLAMAQVEYAEGDPEIYSMPLVFASGERSAQVQKEHPLAVVARLTVKRGNGGQDGVVYDGFLENDVCDFFLQAIGHRRRFRGDHGEIVAYPTRAFRRLRGAESEHLPSSLSKAEQSNTSVFFGDRLILKLIRKLDEGQNPDLEIGIFLTERAGFPHIPPVAGALEYRRNHEEPITLAILQGFVPNQGDAWIYTLDYLGRYYERAMSLPPETETRRLPESVGTEAGRRGGSGTRGGPDRDLPRLGPPDGAAHGGDACRAGVERRGPLLCPRVLLGALPALPLSVDAEPHLPDPASSPETSPDSSGNGSGGGKAGSGPPGQDFEALPVRPRPEDHGHADPRPRGLPPRAGSFHGEGLRDHRLRGGAGPLPELAQNKEVPPAGRGGHAPLLPLRGERTAYRKDGRRRVPAARPLAARTVGELLDSLGLRSVSLVVPGGFRPGLVSPEVEG